MGFNFQRSTSEPYAKQDVCGDQCLWKKRFLDLVRENEKIKQKYKESLSQMETRCSNLTSEKIAIQTDKYSLQGLIQQQQLALNKQHKIFQEQKEKIGFYESQYRDSIGNSTPANRLQPEVALYPNSRQSEMINSKNIDLQDLSLPTGHAPLTSMKKLQSAFVCPSDTMTQVPGVSDDTGSIMMPTPLSRHSARDNDMSPATGLNTRSDGTPQVAIIEEKDGQDDDDDDSTGFNRNKRRSDFSLSHAAEVNPDNGEITPLRQDETNISADDIIIDNDGSIEGVGERNNPFDQHPYTHHVDNEDFPRQPKHAARLLQSNNEENLKSKSVIMNQAEYNLFRDEFVKQTPSFLVMDDDPSIQINRNHYREDSDKTPAQNNSVMQSLDSNIATKQSSQGQRQVQTQKSGGSTTSLPPLVSSASKEAQSKKNAWANSIDRSDQEDLTADFGALAAVQAKEREQHLQQQSKVRKYSKKNNKISNLQASDNNLRFSQDQSLQNMRYERADSDEIELKSSEDGCDEGSDDCEFESLEGKALPDMGRIPKTQTKFNQTVDQLNQMRHQKDMRNSNLSAPNKLDVSNQRRIQAMQQKAQQAQLYRITEETLQTTTDFTTTIDQETNRLDQKQMEQFMRLATQSMKSDEAGGQQPNDIFKMGLRQMPIDGGSSTAIVIDEDELDEGREEDDELFVRDENNQVEVNDAAIVYTRESRGQSSYVQDSEFRASDLHQNNYTGVGIQPLERGYDEQDEMFDPSNKSESVIQFNARFSTLRSEREGLGLVNTKDNCFFLPKSFSQAVPGNQTNDLVEGQLVESRPTTNLVENSRANLQQPVGMSNSMSLPLGVELNFDAKEFDHETIEENIDGEESKEAPLSGANKRIHGASFVKRGYKRESTMYSNADASENDCSSQVQTQILAFDVRFMNPQKPSTSKLVTTSIDNDKSNDSKQTVQAEKVAHQIVHTDSFGTPAGTRDSGQDQVFAPGQKDSILSNNFFHPVLVSEKSNFDHNRYMEVKTVNTMDNNLKQKYQKYAAEDEQSFEMNQEPEFFNDLENEALSSRQSLANEKENDQKEMKMQDLLVVRTLDSETEQSPLQKYKPDKPKETVQIMNKSQTAAKLTNSMVIGQRRQSDLHLTNPRLSFNLFNTRGKAFNMHSSILTAYKAEKGRFNLLQSGGQFDQNRRQSQRTKDGTLKLGSVVGNSRHMSITDKSQNVQDQISEDEDKPPEYQHNKPSDDQKQKLSKLTTNKQKRNHLNKHKNTLLSSTHDYDDSSQNVKNHAKTADSNQLAKNLEDLKQSGLKQQQNVKQPLDLDNFQNSLVDLLSQEGDIDDLGINSVKLQTSPAFKQTGQYFSNNQVSRIAEQIKSNEEKKPKKIIGELFVKGLNAVTNMFVPKQESLLWFQKLIKLETIQSNYFFQKYLVAGVSDQTMAEKVSGDFKQYLLPPSILFQQPELSRSTSNFANDNEYLLDEETIKVLADFCFPNGVPVVHMGELQKGLSLREQSKKMIDNVNDCYDQHENVREDMFCFSLDASDAIEMSKGEEIYGDSHLVALVHTFQDFKEFNGELYLTKRANCIVTNSQENFELLYELLEQNMKVIKMKREEFYKKYQIDESDYPKEIRACLQIRYEDPPDQYRSLIEQIQKYKINEMHDENNPCYQVNCDEGITQIKYEFPRCVQQALAEQQNPYQNRNPIIQMRDMQLDLIEHHWHMPIFFSLFGPDTFYKLLTAVLLERSIVFVHQKSSIVSSVIMALKALLRPFMWCHAFIPVLPRIILDHLFQPLPIIVGISHEDYDKLLKETTEQERQFRSWVFLDDLLSKIIKTQPEYLPFKVEENELTEDRMSGICIAWGSMDRDFQQDYRSEMLVEWLDDMKQQAKPHFDAFQRAARLEEKGAESFKPDVLRSFDQQLDDAKFADQQREARLEVQPDQLKINQLQDDRPSLDKIMKTERKKPGMSCESLQFTTQRNQMQEQLCLLTQATEEDKVLQRDSNVSAYERYTPKQTFATSHSRTYDQNIVQEEKMREIIVEATDHTMAEDEFDDMMLDDMQRPIVLVASKGGELRHAIEQICLCLARTYKEKIMSLVPQLCKNCEITEADQVFDSDKIANEIEKLAVNKQDEMFLQQFAYTQIFFFILENYVAACTLQKTEQQEDEMQFDDIQHYSRPSDYMLSKFDSPSKIDLRNSVELSQITASLEQKRLFQLQQTEPHHSRKNNIVLTRQATESSAFEQNGKNLAVKTSHAGSLKDLLEPNAKDRARSQTSRK